MDDSSPPTPELPERKNRLSSNSGIKRNKVSRACDECRKRKVRCDGAQPCARCQKSSTECIFSNVTPKRGPPKQYLEPFEARLKTIDTVLQVLQLTSNDIKKDDLNSHWEIKEPMIEANEHLDVSSIGHALYIPDFPARLDRIKEQHKITQLHTEPPQPANLNISTLLATQRLDLIQSYFDHIHPSVPFISRAILAQPQPPPLLLYAIYAVSSRFITNTKSNNNDPPGWSYYKTAISLIDAYADVPRLTTVQALLLIAKYHEHIRRPGFFWRTKFYIQLAVKMSNDLGLAIEPSPQVEASWDGEFEWRKRAFWAVYTYQVLLSTEHGLQIEQTECTIKYPHVLSNESNHDVNAVLDFYWLSKVIHTQASVVQFMRLRYDSSNNCEDDTNEFSVIEKKLNDLGDCIPPLEEKSSIYASFTYLIYHLSTILLFRPYADENNNSYITRCISSASMITQIVDHYTQKEGTDVFYTVARGIQQIIYSLTAAVTIQRTFRHTSDATNEAYEKSCSLLQIYVAKSPVTEIENTTQEAHVNQQNLFTDRSELHVVSPSNTSSTRSSPLIPALNSPHSPSLPAPTIRKRHSRSSLQFPASDVNYVMQSSSTYVPEIMSHHRIRSTNRSPYANNRLSAPLLGSLYQQSPYYLQMQQQQQHQMQQQIQQQQQQQISSYSQPSSPTTSQFSGNGEYHIGGSNATSASGSQTFPVIPRRTTSLSRKTGLRRSASSTGEFIVPSQQSQQPPQQQQQRNRSTGPYMNPRRHTLTSAPPDVINAAPPPSPRNLHAMAVRNNRFSAPVMTNNTHLPYTIPITQQQQQFHQQSMMLDPSFPMDPVIPDSPNESMMGLLLNPWDFSSQQQP